MGRKHNMGEACLEEIPKKLLSSVQFSCSVVSNTLQPHEPQHSRPPFSSPTAGVYPDSCPLSRWCHGTISSSSPPAFNLSQHQDLFQWISISPQLQHQSFQWILRTDWYLLGWTGWISLQSKGLSRVFSNITVQKHKFFATQLSSQSNSHIHTQLLEKP